MPKPCPFCGGRPLTSVSPTDNLPEDRAWSAFVHCAHCKARIEATGATGASAMETALARWDARQTPAEAEEASHQEILRLRAAHQAAVNEAATQVKHARAAQASLDRVRDALAAVGLATKGDVAWVGYQGR